jgi:hypothetical protein
MGKVHIIGVLRQFCLSNIDVGNVILDAGPLLGSPPGGPFVDPAVLHAALDTVAGMQVLVRDSGPNVEVCSLDGDVWASIPPV